MLFLWSLLLPFWASAGQCPGVCQTNSLSCPGGYKSGLCPGGNDIQCCVESTTKCAGTNQQCQDNSLPCSGSYLSGLCPGANNIQCCDGGGSTCSGTTLFSIGGVPVRQLTGDREFYWTNSLQVDADGSPNAYNPSNTGIDYLANAGSPGNWWGIATDNGSSGKPYVQGSYPAGSYAPFPGFYVSTTSLENSAYPAYDVRRFANAVNLTFIVLPGSSSIRGTSVKMGDMAFVYSKNTGKSSFAVYADVGPASKIGEASVGLHTALGNNPYNSAGRVVNGIGSGVTVLVFPGSGTGKLPTQAQINSAGQAAFSAWGGMDRFNKCLL